jgi:uncharacterized spore protein YtfJ
MDVGTLLEQARDTMTVRRVFGEPVEKDGVTVIPVANVVGGGGGGSGTGPGGEGGTGGGFGVRATPAGVYVIKNGNVAWQPVVDVNRAILGGQIAAIVLFLTIRAVVRALAEGRSARHMPVLGASRRLPVPRPFS